MKKLRIVTHEIQRCISELRILQADASKDVFVFNNVLIYPSLIKTTANLNDIRNIFGETGTFENPKLPCMTLDLNQNKLIVKPNVLELNLVSHDTKLANAKSFMTDPASYDRTLTLTSLAPTIVFEIQCKKQLSISDIIRYDAAYLSTTAIIEFRMPEKANTSTQEISLTNTIVDYDVLRIQSDIRIIKEIFGDDVQLNHKEKLSEIFLDLDWQNRPLLIRIPKTNKSMSIIRQPKDWERAYPIIKDKNSTIVTTLGNIDNKKFQFRLKCTVLREWIGMDRAHADTPFDERTEYIELNAMI